MWATCFDWKSKAVPPAMEKSDLERGIDGGGAGGGGGGVKSHEPVLSHDPVLPSAPSSSAAISIGLRHPSHSTEAKEGCFYLPLSTRPLGVLLALGLAKYVAKSLPGDDERAHAHGRIATSVGLRANVCAPRAHTAQ